MYVYNVCMYNVCMYTCVCACVLARTNERMNEGRCASGRVHMYMHFYGMCLYACIHIVHNTCMNYMCMAQYNKVD